MFPFFTSHAYSLLHEVHHFQRGYSPKSANQPVITTYHTSISPRNSCITLTKRFPLLSCHSTPCCSPPPPVWAHQPTSTVAYPAPAAACRKTTANRRVWNISALQQQKSIPPSGLDHARIRLESGEMCALQPRLPCFAPVKRGSEKEKRQPQRNAAAA
jgi:hypothetical protein